METTSTSLHATHLPITAPAQGDVLLSVADDERDVMPFARHAGSVSRFPEIDPRSRREDHLRNEDIVWNTHSVQHRRNRGRAYLRPSLAKDRQALRHHVGPRDLAGVDPGMGVRNVARRAGGGIVLDANRSTGSIRC